MSTFGSGDRVRITLNDSGRQGTVERRLSSPPAGAASGSGPWYIVLWDACTGSGAQSAPAEQCDLARVR